MKLKKNHEKIKQKFSQRETLKKNTTLTQFSIAKWYINKNKQLSHRLYILI